MDMSEKEKNEIEKRNENGVSFPSSSDWQFASLAIDSPMVVGASPASASMANSFSPSMWEQASSSQNLGFGDVNVPNGMGINKGGPASFRCGGDRQFDMGMFLPTMLPQSLSQFPADSGFIERAARFSSFNGGNFSDMVNPFGIAESLSLYSRGGGMMQGPREVLMGNGLNLNPVSGLQSQKNELNTGESSKDASLAIESRTIEGSPLQNDRRSESLPRSNEEAKQGNGGSGNESDEAEFSGDGVHEDGMVDEPSPTVLSSKKRKRTGQNNKRDQTKVGQKPAEAATDKGELNTTTAKSGGKQGKQGSPTSDPPKEDYIHVRARRGQATNSHSLAERVRREKISERMKFLQDLVPGCNKVTGKAVMLDEIINYVQSLQRQVEFLSMKIATVNPRLDCNIEGLQAKDILQSRAGPSSIMGFPPDMPLGYPPLLHPSQPGLVQAAHPGSSSDLLRRTISSHLTPMSGGFKDPTQLSSSWDEELHNVIQMNYATSAPLDSQDVNTSLPPGRMKVEL